MADVFDRLKAALSDRYSIEREIGAGGMATVYLAEDLKHKRKVAVKVLRPELAESLGAERFLREVEVTAKLNHPHILPLLDSGTAEEQPSARPPDRPSAFLYYVMPFVEGESLRDRVTREGQLPLDDALQITRQVAAALGYAHSQGVIHRDIKPENILLSAGEAVVADFGIARAVSEAGAERLTETGLAVGTPAYMSPEQASGEQRLDGRSDIYALGCVLYEMLAGDAPYTASTPQALIAKKLAEPTPRIRVIREAVPAAVEAALTKALVKNPADRFVTALQFVEALEAQSDGITPARTAVVSAEGGSKNPAWRWLAAVVGMAAIAVAGVLLTRGSWAGADSASGGDEIERLVVIPFENRTGDSAAGEWAFMVAEWLTRSIDRAGLTVIPASTVRDMVRDIDPSAMMPFEEITRRTRARYAVAGSYSLAAENLRFDLELTDAESGELLEALDPISGPVDSLDAVIALVTERVTAATVVKLRPDLDGAIGQLWSTPPSMDAVRGLLATQDLFCQARWGEVVDQASSYLRETPDFAPLLIQVAIAYINLGRNLAADSVLALIEPHRDQLSTVEQLMVNGLLGTLRGDNDEMVRSVEQMYRISPGSYGYQAGFIAASMNRLDDALERLLANDLGTPCRRQWWPWWQVTAEVYFMLGRYQESLDITRDGIERFPNIRPLLRSEAVALAGLGQMEAVDSLLEMIAGLPVQSVFGYTYNPGSQMAYIANLLKGMGLDDAYAAAMNRSLRWFAARPESELRFYRGEALYYSERWADVDTIFAALIADLGAQPRALIPRGEPADVGFRGYRGVALAHLGRHADATEIDQWLQQLDRPDLLGQHTRWRAAIAAALGDRPGAVQLLDQAMREGMGLGYSHYSDPEWESLRDYEPYKVLMRPARLGR